MATTTTTNNNNNKNKNPNLVLSVSVNSLLLLLLFHGSLANQFQQQDEECQLNRLEALQSDNSVVAEAGVIHTWNPKHDQLQCAGVALVKYVIEYKGFLLPSYFNAPQLLYIHRGSGVVGVVFPGGCQKLHRLQASNLIVIPAGVAFWAYGDGDEEPFEAISFLHTANQLNQLDPTPRRFYLGGNPEDEFAAYRQQQQQQQRSSAANNLFGSFNTQRLVESLKLDVDTIRKLQGNSNDHRKNIVRVDGELGDLADLDTLIIKKGQPYSNQGSSQSHQRGADDDDMYSCSVRLKHNVLDRTPDRVYTPRGGYIFAVNGSNIPILKHLRFSVEAGYVPKNSSYIPHWNTNAHSVIYALHGSAKVQVVNDKGKSVFDGQFMHSEALVVPQNYAVVINGNRRFMWVAFKTNDQNAVITLAGPKSFIRTLPEGVLQNIYNLSRDQVENIVEHNSDDCT